MLLKGFKSLTTVYDLYCKISFCKSNWHNAVHSCLLTYVLFSDPRQQAVPLSFSNPLQSFHNQHLETTFGAETVTYASVSNDFRQPSHNANSNNSSLSTRQSTTTTDSQRSSSHDETSDSLPRHSPCLTKHQVYGAGSHDTDRFLLPAESVSQPILNAHLKTGLQSCAQRQRHGEAPQPKPRKSSVQDQKVSHRKFSVPSVAASASPRSSVRRGSMGNPHLSISEESTAKYPKFELLRGGDHNALLKLNDSESRRSTSLKHNSEGEEPIKLLHNQVSRPESMGVFSSC